MACSAAIGPADAAPAACRGRSTQHLASTSAPRGFTLIELMVAIAVMALIAIMSWRGLDGMVRAQEQTRQRTDGLLVMQTALAQWKTDLDALQAIEGTEPLAWDGQVLRITRHGTRQPDDGARVVAWTLRAVGDGTRWLRWQSGPLRTRGEWNEAWQHAAQWARTPSEADRRSETVLMPLLQWQLFYFRGGAWSNAQSSAGTAVGPQVPGGLTPEAASVPDGISLHLMLPPGGALAGAMTIDWVNPLQGGNKS